MLNKEQLDYKTREELYLIITNLNITNDRLKCENFLLKCISNNFQKFYKYFEEINESFISNEVLNARNEIKQWIGLKGKQCSVKINKLKFNENQLKDLIPEKKTNDVIVSEEEVNDNSIDSNSDVIESENVCKEVDNNLSEDNVVKDITDNDSNDKTNNCSEGLTNDCDDIQSSEKELMSENNVLNELTEGNAELKCVSNIDSLLIETNNGYNENGDCDQDNDKPIETNESDGKETNVVSNTKEDSDTDVSEWNIGNDDNDSDDSEDDQEFNGSRTGKYKCKHPGCDAVLSTTGSLTLHMNIHSDRTYECTFNGCHTVVKTRDELQKHETNHRKSLMRRKCLFSTKRIAVEDDDTEVEEYEDYERPYACDWKGCDKRFKNKYYIRDHRKACHENKGVCTFANCNKVLSTEQSLKKHMDTHTAETYECDYKGCQKICQTKSSLYLHKRKYHGINKYMPEFACTFPDCNKVLSSKAKLDRHMDIHSDKTYECDYDGCNKVCNTRSSLNEHKKKHSGKYRCKYQDCTYAATTNGNLKRHQISHSYERSVKCEECDQYFKDSIALQTHRKVHHPDHLPDIPYMVCEEKDCQFKTKSMAKYNKHKNKHLLPFECDICQKKFSGKRILDIHRYSHSDKKSFQCQQCSKCFQTPSSLGKHRIVSHNSSQCKCDWPGCDKVLKNRQSMKIHIKQVHQTPHFKCQWPECDRSYTTKERLKYHENIHKGVKPYKCLYPECGQSFADLNVRNVHSKRHTGEHVYKCRTNGCHFGCIYWTELKKHEKEHGHTN